MYISITDLNLSFKGGIYMAISITLKIIMYYLYSKLNIVLPL